MADRRDRLGGMTSVTPPNAPTVRLDPTVASPPRAARRQALLIAPPPANAGPYVTILEAEGLDVLVAISIDSARVLLENASPSLIVALVPLLGDELREELRRRAPNAELRVFSGLASLLEETVVPPRSAFDFALRAIVATAGVLASARGTPRERTVRILQWSGRAAASLKLPEAGVAAVRVIAALYDLPRALAPAAPTPAATSEQQRGERDTHRALLREFIAGLESPFPIDADLPPGDPAERDPAPLELVEAAGAYALLVEQRVPNPALVVRKLGASGELHPIACEAVVGAAAREQGGARNARILVIDSDSAARNLLALRLTNEGYDADVAADGRAALEMIRRDPPALIITETVLSGLDGFALLDTLRHEGRHIPLVFLSTRNDPVSINKGLLLGASDFLVKPINTEILLTKLQRLLGHTIAATELSARLTLSDVSQYGAPGQQLVSYDELAPGVAILGRFRLLEDLGEGGMGKVFRARDERLDEDVVVKIMKESLTGDPKTLEHFKREIRLARRISHPSVVRIFDFWEAGPLKFVTMEYLQGVDLSSEIKRRGAFPIPVAVRLASEFFEGLAAAHDIGIVHRDIKPHNVLLLTSGRLKVLDFGIAQGLDPSGPDAGTITTTVIGTPDYMSPEQLLGQRVDVRTDLYSAGIMLYEVLTGRLPFHSEDRTERITARLHRPPAPPSTFNASITPPLDAFIMKLLATSREQRQPSARAVIEELQPLRT